MKTIKFIYFGLLAITISAVIYGIVLLYILESERIVAQRNGTWDVSMSGAGMALIAPIMIVVVSFLPANILGLILLSLNNKRNSLKNYEKKIIITSLILVAILFILYKFSEFYMYLYYF